MPPPRLILPFADYSRIFRVIYSVLDGRAHTHRACVFFAIAGALILRRHYKLSALPVSGAAAYLVDYKTSLAATFGKIEDGMLVAGSDAFHCWIECDGFAIDFMAPVFRENMQAAGIPNTIARKMFQRPLSEAVSLLDDFTHEGVFSLVRDGERTQSMIENFDAKVSSGDLANVCSHWYRRPPKRIPETQGMADDRGGIEHLRLHGPEISGVW
ncbi:MAG: DUF2026 family protein [Sterolibacterium sp.]|nr:DUF2026 family protein [Sterolibacterium sp.]